MQKISWSEDRDRITYLNGGVYVRLDSDEGQTRLAAWEAKCGRDWPELPAP